MRLVCWTVLCLLLLTLACAPSAPTPSPAEAPRGSSALSASPGARPAAGGDQPTPASTSVASAAPADHDNLSADQDNLSADHDNLDADEEDQDDAAPSSSPQAAAPFTPPDDIAVDVVADGLQLPANLAFAPDGRLFLTEVGRGTVRVIEDGHLLPEPVITLNVASKGEQGLLGLALDPSFAETHHIYLYYSELDEATGEGKRNRVVRVTESAGGANDLRPILDNLPINNKFHNASHNGGRLAFGPDGKLYITVGDMGKGKNSQDKGHPAGKILRINPDGSIPSDNPSPKSPVFAFGFRNSFGLAFHPLSGKLYATDNGPSGRDEVNLVTAGGNYGSPQVSGIRGNPRFIDPLWDSRTDRGGIAGLTFYNGALFPHYRNSLLFCTFTSGRLRRLQIGGAHLDEVQHEETLSDRCNLDVVTGPDGAIYISSAYQVLRLRPA